MPDIKNNLGATELIKKHHRHSELQGKTKETQGLSAGHSVSFCLIHFLYKLEDLKK